MQRNTATQRNANTYNATRNKKCISNPTNTMQTQPSNAHQRNAMHTEIKHGNTMQHKATSGSKSQHMATNGNTTATADAFNATTSDDAHQGVSVSGQPV